MSGGMFGNADWKSALLAAFAGYSARQNPQVANSIFGNLQQAQDQKRRDAQYQQQRADQNADWLSHQQYQDAHKDPTQTDRYVSEVLDPNTSPERRELLKSILVPPMPAPMTLQTPQGTYIGGRSEMPNAAGGPQPGAVQEGYRFKGGNPADPNAWEKAGGPGLGGPGGFPGY